MDEPEWNHAVFSKNRERPLNADIARTFFAQVLGQARVRSDEHFTEEGTLTEASAIQKKNSSDEGDRSNFRGQQRRKDTHQSKPDPLRGADNGYDTRDFVTDCGR